MDGSCQAECPQNLVSACSCPGAPAIQGNLYPCHGGETVDIPNFNASNMEAQTMQACANKIGVPDTVPAWNPNPSSIMWGECPTPDYGPLTYHEPAFIALYTFYGSCLVSLIGWTLYKRFREKVVL